MVHGRVPLTQAVAVVAEPVEAAVLQGMQIARASSRFRYSGKARPSRSATDSGQLGQQALARNLRPSCGRLTIRRLSGRLRFNTSDTRPLGPMQGSRSRGVSPSCSTRNLMVSTGSAGPKSQCLLS